MVPRAPRILLWLSAALLALLPPGVQAGLFHRDPVVETVYQGSLATVVAPTSYVVPTSYVATTSYAVPTSYVVPTTYSYVTPTVYTSSSYVVPTSYTVPASYAVPTSYVVPTTYVRSSRYRPRSYTYDLTSTAYYLPTSVSYPLVTTSATSSAVCCESAAPVALPANSAVAAPAAPASNGQVKQSTPLREEREPGLDASPARPRPQPVQPVQPPSQPVQPLLDESPAEPPRPAAPATDPAEKDLIESPPDLRIPADGTPGVDPTGMREVKRPAFGNRDLDLPKPKPGQLANLLRGRIVSGKTRQPEAGVKVTFANEGGRFRNRTFTSNGQGQFDVPALPDGDWTVEVEDAAGKAVPYATLTVSGGRVTDDRGVEWSTLTLNR